MITVNPKDKKELEKVIVFLEKNEVEFHESFLEDDENIAISDAEKKSIEVGLKDAEQGKFKAHSEVKKLYEKWL